MTKLLSTSIAIFTSAVMICLYSPALASNQVPAPPQDHPIALVGGTIHPVSGPEIENGTILFDNGRIVAIGTNVTLPQGTEQIDITGKHVYPGIIAANTTLGLAEIGAVRATNDVSEVGDITPNVRAEAAVNPDSELLPVTRANGVLLALSVPGGGLIAGTSGLMMMDGWTWEDMTLKGPVAMHVWWPALRRSGFRAAADTRKLEEQRRDRDENIGKIRTAFREARAYMKAKEAESQNGVPYHDTDSRWEAMIPVLKREIPVIVHASEILEIQGAIDWAVDEGIRVILAGGRDAWRVTDLLKEHNIPVMISAVHLTPRRRDEDYDIPYTNPMKLYQAGIKICISGGEGESPAVSSYNARHLPYQAATAASYGLPKDEALKCVTLYPAEILGVADRVGSLELGKDATLFISDGDPLEILTQVERAFIQGRDIQLKSKHTMLYEKYKVKYERQGVEQD
ncbi:MAG TPA: hypothetical protein EYQ20_17865 [candidate division Zixibacteria bacterium]|nr:hypothetical protein [candidate division Zixibacteria bacterium]